MSFDNRERKNQKFASILKQEISEILTREISDPRLGFFTITDIKISPDRKHAKVFISILGSQQAQEESLKALIHAKGYVRHILSKKLETRSVPEIEFVKDENPAAKIEEILKQINQETGNEKLRN